MTATLPQLIATLRSSAEPSRERLHAARSVLWILEHEMAWQGLDLVLARVMVSRWLNGVTPARSSDFELVEASRSGELLAAAASETVSPLQAALIAKLLYDAGEYRSAIPYFAQTLNSAEVDAETALLAAYNLEHLARLGGGLVEVDGALEILERGRFDSYADSEAAEAEWLHCTGHLYLMKGQLSGRPTGGYSRLGSDLLRQATERDPSYTSCFTSSFAERGDYVTSINASLDALQRRPFSSLPDDDAVVVSLEVLFYLAYGLLSVGEYERARSCLAGFIEAVDRLEDREARDHARLFMIKLELKRRLTSEFTPAELAGYYTELRALAFESPLSEPVAAEARRYERVLEFLIALIDARQAIASASSLGDDAGRLSDAVVHASDLVRLLVDERPGLLNRAVAGILAPSAEDGPDPAVTWMLEDYDAICELVPYDRANFSAVLADANRQFDTIGVWADDQTAELVRDHATISPRTLILFGVPQPQGTSSIVADTPDGFRDLVVASAALILAKRFLIDDEYIFGLTPCASSPATKYQFASYALDDIRPFGHR